MKIKKRIILLACLCSMGLMASCGKQSATPANAVEANTNVTEEVNSALTEIMNSGKGIMSCLSDMDSEYESLKQADKYASSMKSQCLHLIEICQSQKNLQGMLYQTKILENSIPTPIADDDPISINNQKALYQIHLQTISSSFNYFAEYLSYLNGEIECPSGEKYYAEVPEMTTPDSVIYDITYDSKKTESGVIQYMYILGKDETDAMLNYNAYLKALTLSELLSVDISDNAAYVSKDDTMVSAMMAGNDSEKGYFLIISFQDN